MLFIGMDFGAYLFSGVWLAIVVVAPAPPPVELSVYLLAGFGAIVFLFSILAIVEFKTYLTQFWLSLRSLRKELTEAPAAPEPSTAPD